MKERPILFSGPLVCPVLAGTKTVTRRLVKERAGLLIDVTSDGVPVYRTGAPDDGGDPIPSPFGAPGDKLWVQEAHTITLDGARAMVRYHADGEVRAIAIDPATVEKLGAQSTVRFGRGRPGRFMPRWASRILLEVVSVRVERLHAITEQDAIAEGVVSLGPPRETFAELWDSIHGAGSWQANEFVWRVAFERCP